jgi:serine/threonine protein kinase
MVDVLDRLRHGLGRRYTVEREIGHGGMAVVFLAEDRKHRRPVAIKVVKPEVAAALGADRFLREIEIVARLAHPNILPLYDSGGLSPEHTGNTPLLYYVMPYVEGETLRERLNRQRQLSLEDALHITTEVAEALGYAHALGLVHRDIKPENVLFQAGHAMVSDFGIARAVSQVGGESLTGTGIAVGTLSYMSPEQAAGRKDVDGRSDLYSLGCVLYEMLAGEMPLGPSLGADFAQGPSADLRRSRESVPLPLARVIGKVLARNPADRFATAAQFTESLRAAVASGPITERDGAWVRSRGVRVAALLGVLSLSVVTLLLIGAVALKNRHRSTLPPSRSSITLPAARDAYVRGLNAWRDGSKAGLDSALVYFRQAVELDTEYVEAYAALADAYVMLGYFGYRPRDEMFPKGKDAALRSMQLDSTLASAHAALAYELTWERDFAGADSEFRKAVAFDPTHTTTQAGGVDPTFATAHQWYAILIMILSQKPGAVPGRLRATHQDPFSLHVPVFEITFTKWMDAYPALKGVTSYGPGTMTGEVLSGIDDGVDTHLVARYEVTDPSGTQSFKAVIQGRQNDKTGRADLNGIVTWGWMIGAQVHVTSQRITPCKFGKRNVCFQGTIQIQRG